MKPQSDTVAIRIRIELSRKLVERGKRAGYSLSDMREAIEEAGLSELEELIYSHEERDIKRS